MRPLEDAAYSTYRFLPLVSVCCSEMDYLNGNSRTRRRRIKVRVQQHLMSIAMEAMEQADQAVDQAVQNIEDNADETVNLDFDVDTEVDDLYMASDPDEDSCSDNPEEEPHNDAKRKLAEWAPN